MNKPISTSGLLKELAIGGVGEEAGVVPRNATGLGVVELWVAEVESDAQSKVLDECESTAKADSRIND